MRDLLVCVWANECARRKNTRRNTGFDRPETPVRDVRLQIAVNIDEKLKNKF